MEEREVKPQFDAVAYNKQQTANPVQGEVEKLEVVRPTKVVQKPELPKARQLDKASTMAGLQGDVVRAITGEKKVETPVYKDEVEAEAYEGTVLPAEFVAPAESKMVYPATPVVDPVEEERARRARQSFMEKRVETPVQPENNEITNVRVSEPSPVQPAPVEPAPAPVRIMSTPASTKPTTSKPVESKPVEEKTPTAEPDWRRIFAEQSGKPLEERMSTQPTNQHVVGAVGVEDKSLDDEGTMYQT